MPSMKIAVARSIMLSPPLIWMFRRLEYSEYSCNSPARAGWARGGDRVRTVPMPAVVAPSRSSSSSSSAPARRARRICARRPRRPRAPAMRRLHGRARGRGGPSSRAVRRTSSMPLTPVMHDRYRARVDAAYGRAACLAACESACPSRSAIVPASWSPRAGFKDASIGAAEWRARLTVILGSDDPLSRGRPRGAGLPAVARELARHPGPRQLESPEHPPAVAADGRVPRRPRRCRTRRAITRTAPRPAARRRCC